MILENVEMSEICLTINLHCDIKKGNPGMVAISLRGEDRNQSSERPKLEFVEQRTGDWNSWNLPNNSQSLPEFLLARLDSIEHPRHSIETPEDTS